MESMRLATNDKAAAEYRQALGRELLLKHQFEETKAEVDGLKAHAMEYSQLKTEAENDRRMYMDLESRTREADVNRQFRGCDHSVCGAGLTAGQGDFSQADRSICRLHFCWRWCWGCWVRWPADALDTTFSDADEVRRVCGLEVVATLPEVRRLDEKVEETSSRAHSFYGRGAE